MLKQLSRKDTPRYAKDILRVVYLAYRPLTIQELQFLVEDQGLRQIKDVEKLETIFQQASSLLTVDNNIVRFVHSSAMAIISKFGSHEYFAILPSNIGENHWEMFSRSISNISDLKKDIYGVVNPYTARSDLKRCTSDPLAPLAYSCVHWADHLSLSACLDVENVQEMVCEFLSEHFLHWVEALGWLGELSAGIKQLDKLKSWVLTRSASNDLRIWIDDARRLLIKSRPVLEYAPLMAYTSDLTSAPSSSVVKRRYHVDAPASVAITSGINKDWSPNAITLKVPGPLAMEVFWNGNQRLSSISPSREGTEITHWNVDTCSRLGALEISGLRAYEGFIVSSRNGQKFACLTEHCIYVWDAAAGEANKFEFSSKDKAVHDPEISLSNTGQFLVAASRSYPLMKIWDTTKSSQDTCQAGWRRTFAHHKSRTQVNFLTDTVFASISGNSIFIEDVNGRQGRMICIADTIRSVTGTEDGQILLLTTLSGTIQVWDIQSLEHLRTLDNRFSLKSPVISGDGSKFALIPSPNSSTVEIWPLTAVESCVVLDCGGMVLKVTFSPDGQLLASSNLYSSDIKLWDTRRGCQLATLPGHGPVIQSLSFSPDSRRLAAPSSDGNVKVWELPVKTPDASKRKFEALYHYCSKPIFSEDGLRLAFPWQQGKLGTWDGALIEPSWFRNLKKNLPLEQELYFATSPTGDLLALGAVSTLVLWDLDQSRHVSTLTCPNFGSEYSWVRSIKFLKDGFHLLVGTQHRQMILFDTSGKCHKKIRVQHGPIWAMETIITDISELVILSSGRSVNILDFTDPESPTYVCSLDLGGTVSQLLRDPGCDSTIYTPLGVLKVDVSVESYDEAAKSYFQKRDLNDQTFPPRMSGTAFQPAEHWAQLAQQEDGDDGVDTESALSAEALSTTASLMSSILQYRTIHGRAYHSEQGNAEYWGPSDEQQNESQDVNDFADEFPSATVIGTDLSPIQPAWIPPNLTFEIEDCNLTWTFEANSFDYVHMRYLFGSITDWNALFGNAYRVCKPGGWVESYEPTVVAESDDDTVQPGSAHSEWGKFFIEGAKKMGRSCTVVEDDVQRKSMEAAGFVDIQFVDKKVPIGGWPEDPKQKQIGQYLQASLEQDLEGYVLYMASQLLGWTKDEVSVYCDQFRREIRSGKHHAFFRQRVIWGRKLEEHD
ncbi:hypothetical protein FDECE_2101 [Fusarium decemcellulare]|nr:hypothetical protein FDECE_2101 [Fusarium decemcellulare]